MLMLYLFNLSLNESHSTKKMFFKIQFLFIDDSFFFSDYRTNKDKERLLSIRKENMEALTQLAEAYTFNINMINLEQCLNLNTLKDTSNSNLIETTDFDLIDTIFSKLKQLNNVNYQNRYSEILIKNLILFYSSIHKYNKVVLGDSQTSMANSVFNHLVEGRGYNINISYVDNTTLPGKVSLLYPMRDFLEKEVLIMNKVFNISVLKNSVKNLKVNTEVKGGKKPFGGDHSSLISNFLSGLQEKAFPTTPTVINTAEKLIYEAPKDLKAGLCSCCTGRKDELFNEMEIGSIDDMKNESSIFKQGLDLCFGCRRMFSNIESGVSYKDLLVDFKLLEL
eukprot:CAMPEP_0170518560 /NCGR_PEP_ID=MMETSP0209-20121228/4223_1 /TAXON_ID=665100 ORGANISM="Litonotus pictus, Strain P1" /NCGR_SAMPLE_ID=MMETSP0209 /ASSEMBLY_ACC=CAM_ASM_000301 /LENGTH=335 /DNA_ID=CAMNT_0010804169 /DNA_START=537 /DNA_END=1547 /DNA_ORIENTATION=+